MVIYHSYVSLPEGKSPLIPMKITIYDHYHYNICYNLNYNHY
jgi:hypothetical protein